NPPAREDEGEASAEGEAATAETTEAPEAADDGDPIETSVTVSLTDEPVDVRTGTPTVYLGLDKDGLIIQAGYSASAALLGYGAYSFVDAVENNYIVERTLQEAGIAVPEGTAKLPDDKDEYRTYATDGTTIMKEHCPFSGSVSIQDVEYQWSSVLSYDYSVANAGGASNLSDTIRIIYVYLERMPV
ncbi:MAG: histone-lysine N-methyltransferase, partial [Eggerthellaceae bacterium]|nr:histone-lysine N-methyltransferase [Eggerthellaceae bacterium]